MTLYQDGYTIIDNRYITELSADEHTNEITLVIKKAGLAKPIVFDEDEWEDMPEPKEYWFIRPDGDVGSFYDGDFKNDKYVATLQEDLATVGNIFETKEEAERAVEKLKAWKRLREKGFRFNDWDFYGNQDYRTFICFLSINKSLDNPKDTDVIRKDIDLLFGGVE